MFLARQRSTRLITSVQAYSTLGISLCKTTLLISAIEIADEECCWSLVLWYNVGWFQP